MSDNSWDNQFHGGTDTAELDTWGLYVKPMYPITESFDIYALLGYASSDLVVENSNGTSLSADAFDGFSWAIGLDYSFTENVSAFVDYTALHNSDYNINPYNGDSKDVIIASWNFGLTYTF